jgi:hypothetical protein
MGPQVACKNRPFMRRYRWTRAWFGRGRRKGAASLDYVLVLGIILPMAAFVLGIGPRIIRLAYEMVCVLVSWPFM